MQKYTFKPGIWLILFCGSVFAMTVSFGFWQLDRANVKQQLQDAIDARQSDAPLHLPNALIDLTKLSDAQHYLGSVTGKPVADGQFLLENVVHNGKPGFYVYTPVLMNDGQVVLVNRGWVAANAHREDIPQISVNELETQFTGRFAAPRSKPVMVGGLPPANANSEDVWFYVDLELLASKLDRSVAAFVLLQTNSDDSGLLRDWPVYDTKVGMHIGYAIQWFAFAAIDTVFFLLFSVRRRKQQGN